VQIGLKISLASQPLYNKFPTIEYNIAIKRSWIFESGAKRPPKIQFGEFRQEISS